MADLCLAVTSRDEVNLMSASIAREMGATRSVARVFNPILRDNSTFDYQRHFKVDRLISLEHLTALELARNIRSTSVLAVESFVRGGVEVHGIQVGKKAKAIGIPLKELKLPGNIRIGMIASKQKSLIPGGDDCVQRGDHVTLIGAHGTLEKVASRFEGRRSSRTSVVVAGGGETGLNLVRLLEKTRCRVTVLEADVERCHSSLKRLPKATVLHADVRARLILRKRESQCGRIRGLHWSRRREHRLRRGSEGTRVQATNHDRSQPGLCQRA